MLSDRFMRAKSALVNASRVKGSPAELSEIRVVKHETSLALGVNSFSGHATREVHYAAQLRAAPVAAGLRHATLPQPTHAGPPQ